MGALLKLKNIEGGKRKGSLHYNIPGMERAKEYIGRGQAHRRGRQGHSRIPPPPPRQAALRIARPPHPNPTRQMHGRLNFGLKGRTGTLCWGRKKCPSCTIRDGRFGSEASWCARARQIHAGGSCRRASNTAATFGGKMCALHAMGFGQRCGAISQKTRSEPWCVGWGSGFFLRGVPREQKESPLIVLYR